MNIIPYRIRKVIYDRFPLLYHLVANAGWSGNNVEHWNARLRDTWDGRDWPSKVARIRFLAKSIDILSVDSMRDPNFTMSILFAHVRKAVS